MHFTLSHAAAVLPFRRTRLLWSALIIGSFGPDFEYFLRISYVSRAWHHYPDVVLYCLPFTLVVFFLFQLLIKRPAIGLLPLSFQRRLAPPSAQLPRTFHEASTLLASLVVGIGTHLVWDSFTHSHTWPYRHIAALRQPMVDHLYGYAALQFLSSVAGLVILGISITCWYRETPAKQTAVSRISAPIKFSIACGIAGSALAGGAWRSYSVLGLPHTRLAGSWFQVLFVISTVAWFLWELLAYGLVMTLWGKTKGAHR
jgi:hypothetical protein